MWLIKTIDFLLSAKRDAKAARRFLNKAIGSSGKPSLINFDKSGANTAAIKQYNFDENKRVKIRQCKYLNNIVEQDHRFIKRRTRPMLGFKSFWSARATLAELHDYLVSCHSAQLGQAFNGLDLSGLEPFESN
jgi:putative transposase